METEEFDKLFRNKVLQNESEHSTHLKNSKPKIWASIKNKKKGAVVIFWRFPIAAALITFVLCASYFYLKIQKSHLREIGSLSNRIEFLSKNYEGKLSLLHNKEQEINSICKEVKELEKEIEDKTPIEPLKNKTVAVNEILYIRDTVYVDRVEYITELQEVRKDSAIKINIADKLNEKQKSKSIEPSIFPPTASLKTTKSEFFKLKILNYSLN